MARIYEIGDFRIEHRTEHVTIRVDGEALECEHLNLMLDEHGQTVTCQNCGKDIGCWWALVTLAERYASLISALQAGRPAPSGLRVPESQPARPSLLPARKSSTPGSGPQSPPESQA